MQRPLPMHARASKWKAEVHTHDAGTLDLSPGVVSATCRKSLAEPAGSFTMTLKPSVQPGGDGLDLFDRLRDDDWVIIGATDADGADWITTTGLVDSVRRQRVGTAGATTFTVQGRDLGKVLLKTDLLDMPWLGSELTRDGGLLVAPALLKLTLDSLGENATPGRIVERILTQALLGGEFRQPSQFWAVPESLRTRPAPGGAVDPLIRQASDIISTEHIDTDTSGLYPGYFSIPTGVTQGGALWSLLTMYANPILNEMVIDQVAVPGSAASPSAFIVTGDFSESRPSLRFRQRPFPSLTQVGADSGATRWRRLPANDFPESDLEAYDVGRSGAERFNWFSVESAVGTEITQNAIMAMAQGAVPISEAWDSMPAVFQQSIERHGLVRFQQASPFLSSSAEDGDAYLATQWAKLLRDWYAPNPVFLSGTATIAYLAPGVRVGERFRVHLRGGTVEEFYIEAVELRFVKHPDGAAHGNTTLSLTRGWRLPDASADYASTVERWLRDNLEVLV